MTYMPVEPVGNQSMIALDGHLNAKVPSQLCLGEMHCHEAYEIQCEPYPPDGLLVGQYAKVMSVAEWTNQDK